MIITADMGFSLCPMLTYGTVDMLHLHGTDEQKAAYLPKLVTGEWTGTMVLTEPHAGSDVGALSTKAVRAEDGTWRLKGTKIFHHLGRARPGGEHHPRRPCPHPRVLRRGTKGISCFIVPKYLVNADGSPRRAQRLRLSLHRAQGRHPPESHLHVVLRRRQRRSRGVPHRRREPGDALHVHDDERGRLSVGTEGLAVSERSYQAAAAYARQRRQGRTVGGDLGEQAPIIEHPDVRRMLMMMRGKIEAMRGLLYRNALASTWRYLEDEEGARKRRPRRDPDPRSRRRGQPTSASS